MKQNQIIGSLVILVLVAGGSFYAGKSMASSAAPAASTARNAGAGFAGRTGGRNGGGFTGGTIVSASNGSISILQQNGSSTEIVLLSPTTQILKSVAGAASDLTTGANVTVTGTSNSDGSLTASAIQIRPAGMGFPAGRGSGAPAAGQ